MLDLERNSDFAANNKSETLCVDEGGECIECDDGIDIVDGETRSLCIFRRDFEGLILCDLDGISM